MTLITWIIIIWAVLSLIFLRWNYCIGLMNKEYDRMFEDEMKLRSSIDELDEAVRENLK